MTDSVLYILVTFIMAVSIIAGGIVGWNYGYEAGKKVNTIPSGYALVDVGGNIDWLFNNAPDGTEIKLGTGTYTVKSDINKGATNER